ncbi:unnamed protein product [Diabrotica balteata]|uniref:Cyclic nucleotide-binding domain-containing protein n=1 Tax=Diabrotica balteata TaxID=107213 RepID=A0A9N9X8T4_DIABA|nr:unnamed protein product [Diabrotica balteata]
MRHHKVTIFQECQPEFLRDLVLKMKAYIFTPGDSICRKGEVAREMFIIADGILEVISEHGKVLTTMKAGDFFGEIGILNLDGLNKRTADVRSVGYSELFSLSREDVLNAMKDYPEAQEILQALGRKRLMEVKASARNPPNKDHHHGHFHGTEKGLVDKIKSEAKGLRNALKKSKTHRRLLKEKQDNEEKAKSNISPPMLSPTSSTIRSPPPISEEPSTEETIGAGLPLLQRILMLKAKEEKARAGRTVTMAPKSVTGQLFSGMSLGKRKCKEEHFKLQGNKLSLTDNSKEETTTKIAGLTRKENKRQEI